jgi:hypothetical protein
VQLTAAPCLAQADCRTAPVWRVAAAIATYRVSWREDDRRRAAAASRQGIQGMDRLDDRPIHFAVSGGAT